MLANALHAAIEAVCPIDGVSIGRQDEKATWRIDFKDDATKEQRAAAASVIRSFDAAQVKSRERSALPLSAEALAAALVAKGALTHSEIESARVALK
jgi:hypothetical protein